MKNLILCTSILLLLLGCTREYVSDFEEDYYYDNTKDDYYYSYADGYEWAEANSIYSFEDCQYEFGTGDAEDGCNEYVKENYSGYNTFYDYECTEDCSGHRAGYDWAERKGISNTYDCSGNSTSFIEGCEAYVKSNY